MEMKNMERMLTGSEVAKLLGVSRWTVYNYRDKKGMPYINLNGMVKYSRADVLAWVEANKKNEVFKHE